MGSGMPRGLWRRISERFSPARVLEFYASTEADTVLVNLAGTKPGSMGKPLPGSSEVRIAEYSPQQRRLAENPNGFVRACAPGEVGMLLSKVRPDLVTTSADPTARASSVPTTPGSRPATSSARTRTATSGSSAAPSALIRTAREWSHRGRSRTRSSDIDSVDLAVAYGVPDPDGEHELALAAVTLRGHGSSRPSS